MSPELKPEQELRLRVEPNRVIDLDWFTPATIADRDMFTTGVKIRVKVIEVIENETTNKGELNG